MGLRLEIVSEHREFLGDDHVHTFRAKGGTIGRSLQNDWILPDTDKYISGNHATIDYNGGSFFLADISTNGVYVNGDDEPLGRGQPRRLFNGDRLRMGDFEMLVHLDEGEDLEMPPPPPQSVVPDNIEQLVPVDNIRSSIMLLDEESITGDDEFQAALFGTDAAPPDNGTGAFTASNPDAVPVSSDDAPAEIKPQRVSASDGDLYDTFLQAAGLSRSDIHPTVDPRDIMQNAGVVLQELVHGITDLLNARSQVKSDFNLDQTTVMPQMNNPLKLSSNSGEAVKQLLLGQEGEYLGPHDSVKEAYKDLRHHHDAMMTGMSTAFSEFVERLDPDELQEHFDQSLDRKPLFSAFNQLKYWQLYCDLYPIVTQKGTASLPQQLAEDFVQAYDRQIAELKRLNPGIRDTQVINRPEPTLSAANDGEEPQEAVDIIDDEMIDALAEDR